MSTIEQTVVPTGTWQADPVHSDIGFAIDYMSGTFRGTFSKFTAEVVDGTLRGAAEVSSVQVKDENLEAHLPTIDQTDVSEVALTRATRKPMMKATDASSGVSARYRRIGPTPTAASTPVSREVSRSPRHSTVSPRPMSVPAIAVRSVA